MLERHVKALLFLTSYCPLFVIIMIDYYDNAYVLASLIAACVLSITFILVVFSTLNKVSGSYAPPDAKVQNTTKYVLHYFMAYLIPLLAVGDFDEAYVAKYVIALAVMAILYIRSDVIYINPTLILMGYKVYKVSSARGDEVLITKRRIRDRVDGPLVQMADGVYYGRE